VGGITDRRKRIKKKGKKRRKGDVGPKEKGGTFLPVRKIPRMREKRSTFSKSRQKRENSFQGGQKELLTKGANGTGDDGQRSFQRRDSGSDDIKKGRRKTGYLKEGWKREKIAERKSVEREGGEVKFLKEGSIHHHANRRRKEGEGHLLQKGKRAENKKDRRRKKGGDAIQKSRKKELKR